MQNRKHPLRRGAVFAYGAQHFVLGQNIWHVAERSETMPAIADCAVRCCGICENPNNHGMGPAPCNECAFYVFASGLHSGPLLKNEHAAGCGAVDTQHTAAKAFYCRNETSSHDSFAFPFEPPLAVIVIILCIYSMPQHTLTTLHEPATTVVAWVLIDLQLWFL